MNHKGKNRTHGLSLTVNRLKLPDLERWLLIWKDAWCRIGHIAERFYLQWMVTFRDCHEKGSRHGGIYILLAMHMGDTLLVLRAVKSVNTCVVLRVRSFSTSAIQGVVNSAVGNGELFELDEHYVKIYSRNHTCDYVRMPGC